MSGEGVYVGPIQHEPSMCSRDTCGPEKATGCWCSACQHGHHDPAGCWPEPPREWDDTEQARTVLDDIGLTIEVWRASHDEEEAGISTGEATRRVRALMRRLPDGGGML